MFANNDIVRNIYPLLIEKMSIKNSSDITLESLSFYFINLRDGQEEKKHDNNCVRKTHTVKARSIFFTERRGKCTLSTNPGP